MNGPTEIAPDAYIESVLGAPVPDAASKISDALRNKYPGSAIFLYGSGISVSSSEKPTDILFDYYVITPDYRRAIRNPIERLAARLLPPNVYYFELQSGAGVLRSKYALLSVAAFERLTGPSTFHSYFWVRFAQPCRLVSAPDGWRPRLIAAVRQSIRIFLQRSQGLADQPRDWRAVWLAGMNASYRAELRAEASDRAARLIESYKDWPERVAEFSLDAKATKSAGAAFSWRLRAVAGAFLSIARLLKATMTFKGGIDYIAWKVRRHAGVDVGVKPWERRFPFLAAPVVALRYYRLRAQMRHGVRR